MIADETVWDAAVALRQMHGPQALEWIALKAFELHLNNDEVGSRWLRQVAGALKAMSDERVVH